MTATIKTESHSEEESSTTKNPPQKTKTMSDKNGYVYIMSNKHNTVFYTGVTSGLKGRVWQHKNNVISGFTKRYNVHKLVYYEVFSDIEKAIEREKYIKGKGREFKRNLIEKKNPKYRDLYEDL